MKNKKVYVNRELSWLKFNERVLEEAADESVPLCERLSFLSIFQSNLEEFFMVRVGTLQDQMLLGEKAFDNKTNMSSAQQITAIAEATKILCEKRDKVYSDLMKKVKKHGFQIVKYADLTAEEASSVEQYFDEEIAPLLSPMIIGKRQSFPFMLNGCIYAVVVMETMRGKEKIGIIPCESGVLSRMVPISGKEHRYMLVEEVILHFVSKIFENYLVRGKSLVKLTRNADINLQSINDEDLNYREAMAEAIKKRRKLAPVRLEMTRDLDPKVLQVLCMNLGLPKNQVFKSKMPMNTEFISTIRDTLRGNSEFYYEKFTPHWSNSLDPRKNVLRQVEEKDVLLHYPYDSMKPFLKMLHEAARDKNVVSIKMTLYRLAKQSDIVKALVEAAENGKSVVVLVELQARFDEANNIAWSRELENAGCQVIYGINGVKVHSKLCLITKKEGKQLKYISQIGTGNFNEKTAELYTDLALLTANHEIGSEVSEIFQEIGIGEVATPKEQLLVAPNGLQNRLIDLIDEQIQVAKTGGKAYIGLKLNSLTDLKLMDKLIEASKKGVHIDMIVRGICCLVPGVKGETENIHVISIVGRFLEHSRIYIFGNENEKVYIGSADWMTRNTRKRIEVAAPVLDSDLKCKIRGIFITMLSDNVKARYMDENGEYHRVSIEDSNDAQKEDKAKYNRALCEEISAECRKYPLHAQAFFCENKSDIRKEIDNSCTESLTSDQTPCDSPAID